MKSIRHYVIAASILTSLLMFAGVYGLAAALYNRMLVNYAEETSNILMRQAFNALYMGMERGFTRSELEDIVKGITESYSETGIAIEIYRGKPVEKQFGEIAEPQPDNAVSTAMQTGRSTSINRNNLIVEVLPVKAEQECLVCHNDAEVGDVLGVIRTEQSLESLNKEAMENFFFVLLAVLPLPLIAGIASSWVLNNKIHSSINTFHNAIKSISSMEDFENLKLKNDSEGFKEINLIMDQLEVLAKRLRSIATDKTLLQFQIRLMEKLVITAESISDWEGYIKELMKELNEVVEISALFAAFKHGDGYELNVFWMKNPTRELRTNLEESIYEVCIRKELIEQLKDKTIRHHVVEISENMPYADKGTIVKQLSTQSFIEERVGNIIGAGIYSPLIENHDRALIIESTLSTLMNVIGSVRAINSYTRDVEFYATRDPLTNLHNQRMFWDLLRAETKRAERHGTCFSLVVIDFDNFKLINDVYGHAFGDKLLQQFAETLRSCSREEDIMARYGGDEFTLMLPETDSDQAYTVVKRLKESLDTVSVTAPDGKHIKATTSIGIASYPSHAGEDKKLFLVASNMMYKAKREGKNRISIPTGDDIMDALKQEGEKNQIILEALEKNTLIPYFHPIMLLGDMSVQVHELLMRIPVGDKIMAAGEFIADAESMGVMHRLDICLMEKAFVKINECGYKGLLFINLSPKSLVIDEFVPNILDLVNRYEIDKSKIVFEITERETVRNISSLQKFILDLKKEGFMFAIDDFGSGFSSFHYVKMFPIDYIKIEGDFIKNLLNDEVDMAFVKSALTLARELNIKTVAEFVENAEILKSLHDMGVDYAQGFYIDKPMPELLATGTVKKELC
ncbi:putative bifunctional diguanylate cyclase/phosphodiesterase [Limisalsivibrio acetivorans]|uniref:putative bifunctional diguanylate cyclase/phosphodiesterase n=1 Tax=Limisalsivibrio acetivorans TaxID=1304888 RepID=UPI0003B4397C|nr:bifunctional diguanylate cyclase/phosphodiesterase [Limisalsivibrio acetivorans]